MRTHQKGTRFHWRQQNESCTHSKNRSQDFAVEIEGPRERRLDMDDKRLRIEMKQQEAVTIVELIGDLDLSTLKEAKASIQKQLDDNKRFFLVDPEKVGYIDSSGLGFLIGSLKKVKERQGDLKIARLNAYMLGIFKLLNLHEVLEVYDDFDTALQAFEAGD